MKDEYFEQEAIPRDQSFNKTNVDEHFINLYDILDKGEEVITDFNEGYKEEGNPIYFYKFIEFKSHTINHIRSIIETIFNLKIDKRFLLFKLGPGDTYMLYYNIRDVNIEKYRYVIFLNDKEDGQVFQIGNKLIDWKRGDVFFWSRGDCKQGGANFGYKDMYFIMFDGIKNV